MEIFHTNASKFEKAENVANNFEENKNENTKMKDKNLSVCGGLYRFMVPESFEEDEDEEDEDAAKKYKDANDGALRSSDILTALKERTTCTGLPHYHNSRGSVKKTFWLLITIIAMGGLAFNLSQLFLSYMAFKFNVLIKIGTENQLPFPAVTICNMCPIKRSKFIAHFLANNLSTTILPDNIGNRGSRVKRSVTGLASPTQPSPSGCCCSCCVTGNKNNVPSHVSKCKCERDEFSYNQQSCPFKPLFLTTTLATTTATTLRTTIFTTTTTTTSPTTTVTTSSTSSTTSFVTQNYNDSVTTLYTTASTNPPTTVDPYSQEIDDKLNESSITELMALMDQETRRRMGFQFEELVLDCTFEGFDCRDMRYFEQSSNGRYGNCYTFNAGWNRDKPVEMALKTGRRHGLQMVLNVNQFEYLSRHNDLAGIRLVVNEQKEMAFPEEEGISLNPGKVTSLGLKQSNVKRLTPPHNQCHNSSIYDVITNVYQELYPGVKYGIKACMKTCYQRNLIARCGCGNAYLPLRGTTFGSNVTFPPCNNKNLKKWSCKAAYEAEYNNETIPCHCLEPCNETYYGVSLSTAEWPSLEQKESVLQGLDPLVDYDATKYYARNLLKVELFYEEFNYKIISEVAAYELFQFLSDCGGVLGLWLGMSALTICEFIEFLLDLMVLGVSRAVKNRQRRRIKPISHKSPEPQAATSQVEILEPPSYMESTF